MGLAHAYAYGTVPYMHMHPTATVYAYRPGLYAYGTGPYAYGTVPYAYACNYQTVPCIYEHAWAAAATAAAA